jgi:D-alanyl-D-alanine carboxypeptidase/D-alanyl-D-alanine-endopeptidase (penicillin-binding protein 4)
MTDSLKSNGVYRIYGNLIVDPGTFNNHKLGYGWKEENRAKSYSAKSTALAFNDNLLQLIVTPTTHGNQAELEVKPADFGFEIINEVMTVNSRRTEPIVVEMDSLANKFTIHGSIRTKGRPQTKYVAIPNPNQYALDMIRGKLDEYFLDIVGKSYFGSMPEINTFTGYYEKLFSIESPYFNEVITVINKNSYNFYANQLFLTIGNEIESSAKSEQIIKDWLNANKVPADTLIMHDGSGLSIHNRVSVSILTGVLKLMYKSKHQERYFNSLAVSGKDGTLKKAFKDELLHERVFAKTGYVLGARALSGYIRTADGEMLAFSFIINKNKSGIDNFNDIMEEILLELATFERTTIAKALQAKINKSFNPTDNNLLKNIIDFIETEHSDSLAVEQ